MLIGSIALGVGLFVVIGVLRIIFQKSLKVWYLFFYMICFMLICLIGLDESKRNFLPIIFDSGGVTTGSVYPAREPERTGRPLAGGNRDASAA